MPPHPVAVVSAAYPPGFGVELDDFILGRGSLVSCQVQACRHAEGIDVVVVHRFSHRPSATPLSLMRRPLDGPKLESPWVLKSPEYT